MGIMEIAVLRATPISVANSIARILFDTPVYMIGPEKDCEQPLGDKSGALEENICIKDDVHYGNVDYGEYDIVFEPYKALFTSPSWRSNCLIDGAPVIVLANDVVAPFSFSATCPEEYYSKIWNAPIIVETSSAASFWETSGFSEATVFPLSANMDSGVMPAVYAGQNNLHDKLMRVIKNARIMFEQRKVSPQNRFVISKFARVEME